MNEFEELKSRLEPKHQKCEQCGGNVEVIYLEKGTREVLTVMCRVCNDWFKAFKEHIFVSKESNA